MGKYITGSKVFKIVKKFKIITLHNILLKEFVFFRTLQQAYKKGYNEESYGCNKDKRL